MKFIFAILFVAFAFLILGFNIFFRGKKFPETEVGKNKHMRQLGIYCTKCEEMKIWHSLNKKKKSKIRPEQLQIDISELNDV